MKKIVVAADSFKGSLSSQQVADAIEAGIHLELPDAQVVKVPVADGGEGTMQTLVDALHGEYISCQVHDPLMRTIHSVYGIVEQEGKRTAIIDMASASGITLLTASERNPLITTTYGTGELIADAFTRGCRHFIIGIGGSATNDAGKGMLTALGAKFTDAENNELAPGGGSLKSLSSIDLSGMNQTLRSAEFTIICDVNNPLFGEQGAAHIFAPQKGASPADVEWLDQGLQQFAHCVEKQLHKSVASVPGAGAAGGMGAAFLGFFNATLKPGITTVLETLRFEELLTNADCVFTGEGKIDSQTLMGKVPQGVFAVASKQGIPVIALGGAVENRETLTANGFAGVFCIQSSALPLEEAMKPHIASENLKQTTSQIIRLLNRK